MRTIPELEEGTHRAKASGILPSGQPVVVNADGTVSVISQASVTQAVGSKVVFEAASTTQPCVAYDANSNKVVVAFVDTADGAKGKAVVGTISGTNITFGATVTWQSGASTTNVDMVYHAAAQKMVIAYYDGANSGYGTSVVGTVSGTNISFGSTVIFNSTNSGYIQLAYDSSAEKVVVAYQDVTNSGHGTARVGTISGTSISYGSAAVFNNSGDTSFVGITFDSSNNKIVIAYADQANATGAGTAIVGTVSGTSISFGSGVVFESTNTDDISITFDSSSNKVVIAYQDVTNSDFGTAIVGTVSGTSISFGTAAVFEAANSDKCDVTANTAAGFMNILYRDKGDSNKAKFVTATVSGTSLAFSAATSLTSGAIIFDVSGAYDSASKQMVFVYIDDANSRHGTAVVVRNAYSSTTLTSENYIGMSQGGSVADGSSATVDIIGSVSTNQSSLTAGQSYFVQTNGTIGTTAANPSVFAGTAISATSLVVKI